MDNVCYAVLTLRTWYMDLLTAPTTWVQARLYWEWCSRYYLILAVRGQFVSTLGEFFKLMRT